MKKITALVSLLSASFSAQAAIPAPQKKQLLEVHENLSSFKFMSISFNQELWSPLRRRVKKSSGNLDLSHKGAFKWKVTGRFSEVYANDLNIFWIYNEATKHAQCLEPSKVRQRMQFMDILYNIGTLEEKYTVSLWKEEKKGEKQRYEILNPNPPSTQFPSLTLKLIPKNNAVKRTVKEAFLVLDLKNKNIHEVRTIAPDGNRSRILFKAPQPLTPKGTTFTFVPPKGTAEECDLTKFPKK